MTKVQFIFLLGFFLINTHSFAANKTFNYLPGLEQGSAKQEQEQEQDHQTSYQGSYQADQLPTAEMSYFQGKWTMKARRCLSGAPVLDRYIPGRDIIEISFEEKNYHAHSRINGCDYWSSGKYKYNETHVYFSNIKGASNCGPINVRNSDQNRYLVINDHEMKFFSGPFVVGPAPCPMGDILEFTYHK